jgi:hypothetical protein
MWRLVIFSAAVSLVTACGGGGGGPIPPVAPGTPAFTSVLSTGLRVVLVTHRWTGTYLNHATGVYYTGTQWAIFNEDLAAMPLGVPFNVLVVKP